MISHNPFKQAVELAVAGLQTGGEQTELKAMLRFLHMLGILMYFNEPDDQVVVLDLRLATAATKIICEFSIHDLEEHRRTAHEARELECLDAVCRAEP